MSTFFAMPALILLVVIMVLVHAVFRAESRARQWEKIAGDWEQTSNGWEKIATRRREKQE